MRVGTRTHPSSRGRAAGPVAGAGMNSKSPPSKDSGDDGSKVLPAWLGDLWGLASPQPPPPLSRTSSRTTLPVFFDRDGRVGPTKLWLKETHAVAGLTLDKIDQEKQKQEAELARAAQVALEIAQAASRELLNDLHNVTRSLGFWETKLHDTPRSLWWFLLLKTGPRHFIGDVFHACKSGLQVVVEACSSTVPGRSPKKERLPLTSKRMSPHLRVDEKVRALSAIQFSLASAVGEVHRHAGIVAAAWGNANMDSEHLRNLLHNELHGLLDTLQEVSTPKATQNRSKLTSPKMAQSPLSRAVNTEFTPRPSPLGDEKKTKDGLPRVRAKVQVPEEVEDIWKIVQSLEVEGSRASARAKAVILANEQPQKWKRRWVLYSALSSALGSLSLIAVKHSQLCGSSDLDNLMQSIWAGLVRFWNTHAATPWKEIKSELSLAFDQNTDVVGLQQLEESKASLDRMLTQYTAQATKPGYSAPLYRAYRAVAGGTTEQGVIVPPDPFALVAARVEEELRSPLQNMLGGDLMQLLLIQTQVMKVDMESALLQMDQIMRANRLNFSIMAGMPALVAVMLSGSVGSTSMGTRTHRRRTQQREDMRMLLAEAERALTDLQYSRDQSFASGMLLYALNTLYQSVQRHRQFFSPAEWRAVRQDIMTLSDNEVPIESKTLVVGRLARIKAFIPEPHRVPNL